MTVLCEKFPKLADGEQDMAGVAGVVENVLAGEQVVASSFVLDSGIEIAYVGGEVAESDRQAKPVSLWQ